MIGFPWMEKGRKIPKWTSFLIADKIEKLSNEKLAEWVLDVGKVSLNSLNWWSSFKIFKRLLMQLLYKLDYQVSENSHYLNSIRINSLIKIAIESLSEADHR